MGVQITLTKSGEMAMLYTIQLYQYNNSTMNAQHQQEKMVRTTTKIGSGYTKAKKAKKAYGANAEHQCEDHFAHICTCAKYIEEEGWCGVVCGE
mmetsp:Transcript_26527/g.67997  ORF Transcript_26527/g.67997 Transcript_26527/m.67997 type:complete len:94 (-) Transcript_26527:3939-4220(-)